MGTRAASAPALIGEPYRVLGQANAQVAYGSVKNLGHYAASWSAWWPKRPSSTAALT